MNIERNSILVLVQLQTKQALQIQGQPSKAPVLVPVVVLLILLTKEVALDMVDMVLEVTQVVVVGMMVRVLDKVVILKFIILTRPVILRLRDSVVVEDMVVMVQ